MSHRNFGPLTRSYQSMNVRTNKVSDGRCQAELIGQSGNAEIIHLVVENDSSVGS